MKKKHKQLVQEGVDKLLEAAILSGTNDYTANSKTNWFIGGKTGKGRVHVEFHVEIENAEDPNSK